MSNDKLWGNRQYSGAYVVPTISYARLYVCESTKEGEGRNENALWAEKRREIKIHSVFKRDQNISAQGHPTVLLGGVSVRKTLMGSEMLV